MLAIRYSAQFRKDLKRVKKQGRNLEKLKAILVKLQRREPLAPAQRDHALTGNFQGHRECHIEPDWLLIYEIDGEELLLTAVRVGSHSDLF